MALIVYPMNALVNSQLQALRELGESYKHRTGRPFPVRVARYTGQTPEQEREEIRRDPPHILLTNYVMAEVMLVRPEDGPLLAGGEGRVARRTHPHSPFAVRHSPAEKVPFSWYSMNSTPTGAARGGRGDASAPP
jgi:hypothetical protein